MILRQRLPGGINRDVDLGPSSGIRWGAPIGGRMIEAAPLTPSSRGKSPARQEYQRAYQERKRAEKRA